MVWFVPEILAYFPVVAKLGCAQVKKMGGGKVFNADFHSRELLENWHMTYLLFSCISLCAGVNSVWHFIYMCECVCLWERERERLAQKTRVQSQVKSYQKLMKWYLMPPCLTLNIIKYGSKVNNTTVLPRTITELLWTKSVLVKLLLKSISQRSPL